MQLMPGTRKTAEIMPLTDRQLRDAQHGRVYVFNVSPYKYEEFVDGRIYVIPARQVNADISEPLVIDGVVYSTIYKDGGYQWVGRDGAEIAQEVAGTFRMLHASQNKTRHGVFISESAHPAQDVVDAAKAKWIETCLAKVTEGDQIASVNGGVVDLGQGRTASNISADHRMALKETGLKRPWSGAILSAMIDCPECGTSNMPTAAKCKGCDMIFNEELARQRYPHLFARQEQTETRGPGRPRKNEAA